MSFLDDLHWRGLVNQTTDDGLGAWLEARSRVVYAGFDPTADSLHAGSLLPLMLLRRFQRAGHKPIAVVGGATGMIGDPSGKSQERNLLSKEILDANVAGLRTQMSRFLDFEGRSAATLVSNIDWIGPWSYLEFLRDVGKNFPVNVMLAKDSVKGRLGRDDNVSNGGGSDQSGMSYTEFSYMLLQAFDFVHLYDAFQCELQVGGSDQWGNITAGIDLGRRMRGAAALWHDQSVAPEGRRHEDGQDGAGGGLALGRPHEPVPVHQYWINVDDADVGPCLRMLTELPREEIEALDSAREEDAAARASQTCLAEELTRLVHGDTGLDAARRATEIFFGAEIADLDDVQLGQIFADVPSETVSKELLSAEGGLLIVDALVSAGVAKSKGDARRTVEQGGAYVNNRRVSGVDARLTAADLASESVMVLRTGKKRYALLRFE